MAGKCYLIILRIRQVDTSQGTRTVYGIDEIQLKIGQEAATSQFSYTYNSNHNLYLTTDLKTGVTETYDYEQQRLTRGSHIKSWFYIVVFNLWPPSFYTVVGGYYEGSNVTPYNIWVLNKATDQYQRKDVFTYQVKLQRVHKDKVEWYVICGNEKYIENYLDQCFVSRSYQEANENNELVRRNDTSYNYDFEKYESSSQYLIRLKTATITSGLARKVYNYKQFVYDAKIKENLVDYKEVYLENTLVEKETYDYTYFGPTVPTSEPRQPWRITGWQRLMNGRQQAESYRV